MLVSVDRAGRVVIPKDVRDLLGIGPDTQMSLEVIGDELRLTPTRPRGRRAVEVGGWPVLESADHRVVTDADVRRWRDADQR